MLWWHRIDHPHPPLPSWWARSLGVYRFGRDLGYAIGALSACADCRHISTRVGDQARCCAVADLGRGRLRCDAANRELMTISMSSRFARLPRSSISATENF